MVGGFVMWRWEVGGGWWPEVTPFLSILLLQPITLTPVKHTDKVFRQYMSGRHCQHAPFKKAL